MKLVIKLPKRKAKWFYNHLKSEHPKYSKSMKLERK